MHKFTKTAIVSPVLIALLTAAAPYNASPAPQETEFSMEVKMAQATDAKDARKLKSALAKAERVVAKAERSIAPFVDNPLVAAERNIAKVDRSIEQAETALEAISGTSESRAFNDRLAQVKSALAVIMSKHADRDAVNTAAQEKGAALTASGEVAQDIIILETLKHSLATRFLYEIDKIHFGKRGQSDNLDIIVEDTANWNENKMAYEALSAKYKPLLVPGNNIHFGIPTRLREIEDVMPLNESDMQSMANAIPAAVETAMDEAAAIAKDALDNGNFHAFKGLNSDMRMALIHPLALTRLYEAMPMVSSGDAKSVRNTYDAGLERIEKLKEKAKDKIIAANSFDADLYSGRDAAAIKKKAKAGFEAIHGKKKILEIRIPSDQWARHEGWRWSKTDRAHVKFDYSTIDAYVFEQTDKSTAAYWRITIQKRHMENDALIADPASRNRHIPVPDQQILLSNL